MSDAPLFAAEAVEASYGEVQVLWGVGLEVRRGEIVCLVGSNGAGKTTLLRCISGLVPLSRGALKFDGSDLTGASPEAVLRAGIAHVPEGRRLFRGMSVADNLFMGAYLRTEDRAAVRRDLDYVYEIFPRLAERRDQDAGTLSGGEQQMCAIGRGIMSRPKLLMIDELSLGLAPMIVEQLTEVLHQVNRGGIALLVVEQDVATAFDLAQRGFVLDRGRITLSGSAEELARNPDVRQAYMGLG